MGTGEELDGKDALDNEQRLQQSVTIPEEEKEDVVVLEHDLCSDLPYWYPTLWGKPIFNGNPEALGWACDQIGRSCAFIGSGAFLGPALLELARQHLGCDPDDDSPCEGRVYGWIRPSSLLTTYTVVVGICSAAFLPFLGALTDYTRHRRLLGRCFAASFTLLLFPQIFLSESTFLFVAILQIGVAFTGWAETMVAFAYLPELTNSEDVLNSYTKKFTIIAFSTMVIYLLGTYGVGKLMGIADQSVYMSRLGTVIAFGIAAVFLSITWGPLMQKRPPSRVLPANHSLYTAGFIQVYNTLKRICRELPALKWFYLSIAMIEAGFNALITISITYMSDTLKFSSAESSFGVLAILIGSIPGAVLAGATVAWFNPVVSNMMAAFIIMANTIAAAIMLVGPGQQIETYILALIWGLGTGWKRTTDRLLASILIPKGQDAELMGLFLFCGQSLTWLPPLIFTAVNEAGISQRVGIGMLSIYFFIGLVSLSMIRNYREATVHRIESPSTLEANDEHFSVELEVSSSDAAMSHDLAKTM